MITINDCKTALDDLRRRFSSADGEAMLAKFGVRRVADLPDELRSMFTAACEGGPESSIVAGLGARTKPNATATHDGGADPVDPWQEAGRQNNDAARQWHEDAKEARAKGEPAPPLPADPHTERVLTKLAKDIEAARDLGRK